MDSLQTRSIASGYRPDYLAAVTFDLHPTSKPPKAYLLLSGPYATGARWQLDAAILTLGDTPWAVTQDRQGLWLWRSPVGWLTVKGEK